MGGCANCPIRCDAQGHIPELANYGFDTYASKTCMGWFSPRGIMYKGIKAFDGYSAQDAAIVGSGIGAKLADDYGMWCNYGQIGRGCVDLVDFSSACLLTSGRISADMILKAVAARVPVVVPRSIPTTAAFEIAEASGVTVVGRIGDDEPIVYTRPDRIRL
jgi:hypothetical protein